MHIVLASGSPRRENLLKKVFTNFIVCPSSFNEEEISENDPVKFVLTSSTMKAKDVAEKFPSSLVIGADTIVVLGDKIFGKPKDATQAKKFLLSLSNKKHKVITGLALYKKDEDKLLTGYETTYVTFKELSEKDIDEYLSKSNCLDKAGAYGIQDIRENFVKEINGDYDNVVGLPIKKLKNLLKLFTEPDLLVEVKDIAFPDSFGVAKTEKGIVFIPGTLPGDKVKIKILKKKRNYSFAKVLEFEKESEFKIKPECKYFGECGGCAFQNFDYEKQLEYKERYLLETLSKLGGIDTGRAEIFKIVSSVDKYFYRNKMEFAFSEQNDKVFLGLRKRVSPFFEYLRETVRLDECFIFSEIVKNLFPLFLEFVSSEGLSAYNPKTGEGFLRHLVLKESKVNGSVMVILVTKSGDLPHLDSFAKSIFKKSPLVKSFYWVENDQISDVVNYSKTHHIYGEKFILEELAGLKFRIYPQTFFQVNTKTAELLYKRIVDFVSEFSPQKILGLYCGAGPIEIILSKISDNVIGVDSNSFNIQNANENCTINGIKNCNFIEDYVEKFLKKELLDKIDLAIVDPPRGGVSQKALKKIVEIGFPYIIYVSCNPSTLARDLKILCENIYTVKKIASFDFFPHTTHLESLVLLKKK